MSDKLNFEDFAEGMTFDCDERVITESELISFAREYDMQPMHLDHEAAAKSMLKGLAASGWQTAAVGHRMVCDGLLNRSASYGSPGVKELRWRRPVRPDSPLKTRVDVLSVRESSSRPELGFVGAMTTIEQAGEVVCTHESTLIIGRRGSGPVGPSPAKPQSTVEPSPWAKAIGIEGLTRANADEKDFGVAVDLGAVELTAESIKRFAREYDPQPFHLDEEAGKASLFGGLAASGWQLVAFWMQRILTSRKEAMKSVSAEQRADIMRRMGPSPGFLDLRWLRPALAGDTLRFYVKPIEIIPMKSRPTHGIQRSLNGAVNQRGEVVFSNVGQVVVAID